MKVDEKYGKDYSEGKFWDKLGSHAKAIGLTPVENALKLFYAMKLKKATPAQIAFIVLALGYLICPVDAIPDVTPVVGYVDDAGVLSAVVAGAACCADPDVIAAAAAMLKRWFKI